ncbi:DUF3999 family protein [Schinkia sp. CFF1]
MRIRINLLLAIIVAIMIWCIPDRNVSAATTQNSWKDWSLYNPIQLEGSSSYKAVYMTEEVYEHTLPNLADLRIIDNEGTAIPYYIQNGQTDSENNRIVHDSILISKMQKNNDSLFDYKINPIRESQDIIGNKLVFSLPDQNFLKHLVIYGSFDGNHWEQVGRDYIFRTDRLQKNEVPLEQEYKYSYYRIEIVDNAEKISLSKLELIYSETSSEWQDYQKSTRLSYEIKNEDKETIIQLENPQQLKIKEISLEVSGNFQRSYLLFGSEQRKIEMEGIQELYNLSFQDIQISNTSISLAQYPISDKQITIRIANRDNPPLDIQDVNVVYNIDKIVFENNGKAPYRLYYGNPQAQLPQYDLKQFQGYIEKEKQDILNLDSAVPLNEDTAKTNHLKGLNLKVIFNVIVVAISILLAIFLLRKLNNKA